MIRHPLCLPCCPEPQRAFPMKSLTAMTWSRCCWVSASSRQSTTTRPPRKSIFTMLCVLHSGGPQTDWFNFVFHNVKPNLLMLTNQGLGQETSEKQMPSALDFVGIFSQAVSAFTQSNGRRLSQQSILNTCIADYNRTQKVKKWKVDTMKRKIIGNMMRVPGHSLQLLAAHYDLHRHSSSGTPLWRMPTTANAQCVKHVNVKSVHCTL